MANFDDTVRDVNSKAEAFWSSRGPMSKRWVVGLLAFCAGFLTHWLVF